jgi:hypothetical protein
MALPTTINPATPAGTDSPAQGDDQFRALKQAILDIFGIPADPTSITASGLTISAAGVFAHTVSPLNLTAGADFTFGTTDNFALIFKTNGVARGRFTNDGIGLMGTTLATGANASDWVMKNTGAYRFVNAAGSSSAAFGIVGDANDNVTIAVPTAGDSINFGFSTNIRGWFQEQNSGGGLYFQGESSADHATLAANDAVLYTKDNGSGKTQLMVKFGTGAAQVIATEP